MCNIKVGKNYDGAIARLCENHDPREHYSFNLMFKGSKHDSQIQW